MNTLFGVFIVVMVVVIIAELGMVVQKNSPQSTEKANVFINCLNSNV